MASIVYYKKTVPYTVIVRRSSVDTAGVSLNAAQEWTAVREEDLRDFKIANRQTIIDGLIVETEEPNVDYITPNQVTPEQMDEMLSNILKLKSGLSRMDSVPIIAMLLERAKEKNKSTKTIEAIKSRLDELSDFAMSPEDMQGVYNS